MTLTPVVAVRFDHAIGSGRTRPCVMTCVDEQGNEKEIVVKLAAGCDLGFRSLISEAIAALLADELGLSVPEPFLVTVERPFAEAIPEPTIRSLALKSIGVNFGSLKLPPGFTIVPKRQPVPPDLLPIVAEIFAFDVLICNPDRTVDNPNCLRKGNRYVILDHELAFLFDAVVGWKPPWGPGGIVIGKGAADRTRHLFLDVVCGQGISFERLETAFGAIDTKVTAGFRRAIPHDWKADSDHIDRTVAYIATLVKNIHKALRNLEEALR